MTNQQASRKVLLIGSGGYVAETIVPALLVLTEQFEIVKVVNRSGQLSDSMQRLCPRLTATNDFNTIDFNQIDLIFICIPHLKVPQLLKSLIRHEVAHCDVFVATPVFGLRDLKHRKLFRYFNQVYAFENAFALPQFIVAKQLLEQGKIGQLRQVRLQHSGFRYHGFALIRHFFSGKTPSVIRAIGYGAYQEYRFRFGAKQSAVMVEPRDFAVGQSLLAGSDGLICDYPLRGKNVFHIACITDERGVFKGMTVNDETIAEHRLQQRFDQYLPFDRLAEPSLFRQLHIYGAAVVFDGWHRQEQQYLYPSGETLFDNLWLTIAERFGWAVKLMPNLPKWLNC